MGMIYRYTYLLFEASLGDDWKFKTIQKGIYIYSQTLVFIEHVGPYIQMVARFNRSEIPELSQFFGG